MVSRWAVTSRFVTAIAQKICKNMNVFWVILRVVVMLNGEQKNVVSRHVLNKLATQLFPKSMFCYSFQQTFGHDDRSHLLMANRIGWTSVFSNTKGGSLNRLFETLQPSASDILGRS